MTDSFLCRRNIADAVEDTEVMDLPNIACRDDRHTGFIQFVSISLLNLLTRG